MINKYEIINSKFIDIDNIEKAEWIELINPTDEEVELIIEKFQLPEDYIKDAKDIYEISRVEKIDSRSLEVPVLVMMLYPVKKNVEGYETYITIPISMVLTKTCVITTIFNNRDFLKQFRDNIFLKTYPTENKEDLILEIAWKISQEYIEAVKDINSEIDNLELTIKKSTKTDMLYRIIALQKSLVSFENVIEQNLPIIEALNNSSLLYTSNYTEEMIRDLHVENKQAMTMVEKSSKMLSQISNTYSSVISNNLNVIMKIQTSIAIIMTIPTIIGGIWGMNVDLPLADRQNAFMILMSASLVLALISIFILRKKDYL